MSESLLKTPLYDTHVELGGRMVEFAGWSMPVRFSGVTDEHVHTRTACSVFDVSHMGRLKLTGDDCELLLNRLCTRNLAGAEVGRSYYSHMCREDGGILDDLIVTRFESHWGIVCNAVNRGKIIRWLTEHSEGSDVEVKDETVSTAMLAIQGPKTLEVAQEIMDTDLAAIKRYHARVFEVMGLSITVYRSGYTGEDGFEVVVPRGIVDFLLPRLLGTPNTPHRVIKPAGLAARDTLRIEAGMPLYGHEITEEWDPLTAGQGWCVDLTKDFIGAEPLRGLKEKGPPRRLIGLVLDGRRIARQHYGVFATGRQVGEVTSGTLGPTLGKSIAMALVPGEFADEGTKLEVQIGDKRVAAGVVKLPFYKRPK